MNDTAQVIALLLIIIITISNIRYVHSLITTISVSLKELVYLLIKVGTVCKQVEYNYDAIKKINEELKINGKRANTYIKELDIAILCNTARIHALLDTFKIGLFECDKDGDCTWVNKALCEIFGMTSEEILGHGWVAAIIEDQRSKVFAEWMNSVKNDFPFTWQYNIINKESGENIRIAVTSITVRDDHGEPILFFGSVVKE